MKVGVLGSGDVAKAFAGGFMKHGHEVQVGSRTPGRLSNWAASNPKAATGTFADATHFGELIVLAGKAFSSVGNASMVNPQFNGGKPTMFICGNDEAAKNTVRGVLE